MATIFNLKKTQIKIEHWTCWSNVLEQKALNNQYNDKHYKLDHLLKNSKCQQKSKKYKSKQGVLPTKNQLTFCQFLKVNIPLPSTGMLIQ